MNEFKIGNSLVELKKIQNKSISLIYFDPPYNTGREFGDFSDKFSSMHEYANVFLKPILVECDRILCNNGNILVHIEAKISHHIRNIMDQVFGENKFRNEIIWCSGGNKTTKKQLARYHDNIILYSMSNDSIFNPEYHPYDENYKNNTSIKICKFRNLEYTTTAAHNSQPEVNPRINLRYLWNGHNLQWYVTKDKMQTLHDDNRLEYNKKGIPRFKKYLSEMKGIPIRDLWTDINQIQHGEKLNYATQKPVKLLERIVKMYSNKDDIVLDPFAGSGTTGRACIKNNRNYILIDINPKAKDVFEKSIICL
jgi:hypothetical protein